MTATVHTLRTVIGPGRVPAVSPRSLVDADLTRERLRMLESYQDAPKGSATERAAWRWFAGLHAETLRRGKAA